MKATSLTTLSRKLPKHPRPMEYYDNLTSIKCSCSSGKCLRLYCECFINQTYCSSDCVCHTSCQNAICNLNENKKKREEAYTNHQDAFCSCKSTKCLKKYCECFKQNLLCSDACTCLKCENCLIIDEYDETESLNFVLSK